MTRWENVTPDKVSALLSSEVARRIEDLVQRNIKKGTGNWWILKNSISKREVAELDLHRGASGDFPGPRQNDMVVFVELRP